LREFVEGQSLAHLVELGVPAAGLAHGPDGRPFDHLTACRPDQQVFFFGSPLAHDILLMCSVANSPGASLLRLRADIERRDAEGEWMEADLDESMSPEALSERLPVGKFHDAR